MIGIARPVRKIIAGPISLGRLSMNQSLPDQPMPTQNLSGLHMDEGWTPAVL
jgi:hypothetical protein